MKTQWMKSSLIVGCAAAALSACVVAPQQPIGYRFTSEVLPTYVNGHYVGMQASDYVAPEQVSNVTQVTTTTYVEPPANVVYRQMTTPVYIYNPPVYVNPWYGFGTGLGIGVGINYSRGWGGGHRSWYNPHRSHHRHHHHRSGHRGWRR